jgi:hypothetical protein
MYTRREELILEEHRHLLRMFENSVGSYLGFFNSKGLDFNKRFSTHILMRVVLDSSSKKRREALKYLWGRYKLKTELRASLSQTRKSLLDDMFYDVPKDEQKGYQNISINNSVVVYGDNPRTGERVVLKMNKTNGRVFLPKLYEKVPGGIESLIKEAGISTDLEDFVCEGVPYEDMLLLVNDKRCPESIKNTALGILKSENNPYDNVRENWTLVKKYVVLDRYLNSLSNKIEIVYQMIDSIVKSLVEGKERLTVLENHRIYCRLPIKGLGSLYFFASIENGLTREISGLTDDPLKPFVV